MTDQSYFLQDPPRLGNQFLEDAVLREMLAYLLPTQAMSTVQDDLERYGDALASEAWPAAVDVMRNLPRLVQHDGYGRRKDEIITSHGWSVLKGFAAREGLVATGYERTLGEYSRVHQAAKLYMFSAFSANFDCPLAMTDGAARVVEQLPASRFRDQILAHLTSRDPAQFWTSGQWMTERTGGSDISNSETVAVKQPSGVYSLTGYKYFTSATTSEIALGLARVKEADGSTVSGSRGLGLFLISLRDAQGQLRNITVHRLKDKLGTRGVPTAELELRGTPAVMLAPAGKGVSAIASMFNVTRIYNAIGSVSGMRRGLAVARDYAARRAAFGTTIDKKPLHLAVLARLEVDLRACTAFVMHVAHLQGQVECNKGGEEIDALLRLLTPLVKLYTAKKAIASNSEAVEAMGGHGYMEDTYMPLLVRDGQVLSIWEGTTNILSLDVLRALMRSPQSLRVFERSVRRMASDAISPQTVPAQQAVLDGMAQLMAYTAKIAKEAPEAVEAGARSLALSMSKVYVAALLCDMTRKLADCPRRTAVLLRFVEQEPLVRVLLPSSSDRAMDYRLAMDDGDRGFSFPGKDKDARGMLRSRM